MSDIDAYKIVPLRMTANSIHGHSIYMREHFIRLMDPNKPKGRTLFLLNIPPYVTEDSLKQFFSRVGKVQSVQFAEKPGKEDAEKWRQTTIQEFTISKAPFKFKVAYVVFSKTSSIAAALAVPSIDLFSETAGENESLVVTGLQLWLSEYEQHIINDEQELKSKIDKFMAAYDAKERAAQKAERNSAADADGWVTVGKQGHNAGFEQTEVVINKLEQKVQKSKKNKELTNFYTFQIRESKMKSIVELREKFEEDKKKIELIKKSRRFKPF